VSSLLKDVRYALRMLWKQPGFTAVAVVALALGVGANTAIFSVVNTLVFRPLLFPDADRLVQVWATNPQLPGEFATHHEVSPGDVAEWRADANSFEDIALYRHTTYNLTGAGEPERLEGARVSANFFKVLGAGPAAGRALSPEDDRAGAERVVVLSYGLWQRRFGSDPQVIGRTLTLNDEPYSVVGVLPADFKYPHLGTAALWTPFAFSAEQAAERGSRNLYTVARLRPTATVEQAQAEVAAVSARLAGSYPDTNRDWGARLVSLQDEVTRFYRSALLIMLGSVALVLLIACANVANLLLMRASGRVREMAVRAALGASRWRLARQLIVESLLLALVGGLAGLLLAVWGIDLILSTIPPEIREFIPRYRDIGINGATLAFALLATVLASLVFGLAPALHASRPDLNEALKEGSGKASGGARSRRARGLLVVSEIALSVVLLVGACLLIKSFVRLQQVDPGFDAESVLTARIDLPQAGYADNERIVAFYDRALDGISRVPGAVSVGAVNRIPLGGSNTGTTFTVEGRPPAAAGEEPLAGRIRMISPGYFQTMNTPLLAGRQFAAGDRAGAPLVVIVNESMARRFFGGAGEAVGKRVVVARGGVNAPREIVGVVRDVKYAELTEQAGAQIYAPYAQLPDRSMGLVVRAAGDPAALASAIRSAVWAVDPGQPISDIRPMPAIISDLMTASRSSSAMLGVFAGIATLLAALGIYGVISYSVAQRVHEIGIRVALGAGRGDIIRLVVGQGLALAGIGVAVGLAGAFALTRALASLLYGVSGTDPAIFAGVTLLLVGVALLASYIPARRATKVDPMVALRYE
jgi:putative ABC transport system permease protein